MHLPTTNSGTKGHLNISNVGPRFGATKVAPVIIRAALILAVICALVLIAARPAQAQTETVLYNFTGGSDGGWPEGGLTFDGAGNLYGTTYFGGASNAGAVFELSPNGNGGWNETVLHSFCSEPNCADGSEPYGSNVIFDSLGNLYGTAENGGANGYGVVFELSPVGTSWTETVLYSFANDGDGAYPVSGLIFDPAGNLYGVTWTGSLSSVVFELSPSVGGWTEKAITSGYSGSDDGLTMDAAGNIFEVEWDWQVVQLSPNGNGGWNETVVYPLQGSAAALVLDQAGNLYGTMWGYGNNHGKVFKLNPGENGEWTESILHSFNGKLGANPDAGIAFDAAGDIYGTTANGGKYGDGIVFELVAPDYKEKVLWNFNGADGEWPLSGSLILDSAGNLYGITLLGGSSGTGCALGQGCGVVFEVTPPTVKTITTLTSSPNPSTYGQAVTFTAAVNPAPPDGETVTFKHGNRWVLGTGALSGGYASFTTTTLKVGTTGVEAVYGGDSKFGGSRSKPVKQVVEEAEQ
jgi:uncharacterized repeat protein (TIGR03803 family)